MEEFGNTSKAPELLVLSVCTLAESRRISLFKYPSTPLGGVATVGSFIRIDNPRTNCSGTVKCEKNLTPNILAMQGEKLHSQLICRLRFS